jgi:nucleoside-diphosphate-sugar epimerase
MKILVTGGAGFIGSHLVDRLAHEDSNEVIVYDSFSRGRIENLSQVADRVEIISGDITDRTSLQKAIQNVELVYHLAAQSNVLGAVQNPDTSFESNVVGTYEVLRAASTAGVRRVVFTSSREIYGDPVLLPVPESAPTQPKNAYGVSKVAGELYCRQFAAQGLETIVLRLSNVYGMRDFDRVIPLFIEKALQGEPLTVFGNNKILDFLWIEDLVDVFCKVSECPCPPGPVNIGSGKGVNLIDLAKTIASASGNHIDVNIAPDRSPEVGRFIADISLATSLFGLKNPDDPIEHVLPMLDQFRSRLQSHSTIS